jgi:hypothetical protein
MRQYTILCEATVHLTAEAHFAKAKELGYVPK